MEELLSIQEIVDHCERQLKREPVGSIFYREHEAVKAYLLELLQFRNIDENPAKAASRAALYMEILTRTYGPVKQKIADWLKADQAGRLVVLPCKVGDTVYIPNITNCSREAVAARVQGISISVSGRTILRFGGYPFESAWGDGCGKDWFLTREEAMAAIRKEEKDMRYQCTCPEYEERPCNNHNENLECQDCQHGKPEEETE